MWQVWFGPGAGTEASWREVNLLSATSKSGMQQQCAGLPAEVSQSYGSHLCLYCMQAGIPIGGVMGTSAGALTGSLYAAGYSPRQVRLNTCVLIAVQYTNVVSTHVLCSLSPLQRDWPCTLGLARSRSCAAAAASERD
jgi:hypothetical protein